MLSGKVGQHSSGSGTPGTTRVWWATVPSQGPAVPPLLSLAQGPTGRIWNDSFLEKLTGQREESTVCCLTKRSAPVVHREVR